MTTELTLPQRAAVALGTAEHEKHLALLVAESKTITEIKNADARAQCHSALMTLKTARVTIEKTGKAAREDAQAFSKAVITEEKRLIGITQAEEDRLQVLRDKWDADREAERQAKIEAERKRIDELKRMVDDIRMSVVEAAGKSAEYIQGELNDLKNLSPGEIFKEFQQEAIRARDESIAKLTEMLADQAAKEAAAAQLKAEQEAEAARLKSEREELARLRAEAEARRKEDERKAAEARDAQEAELLAARKKQESDLAAQLAESERIRKLEDEKRQHELQQQRAELERQNEEMRLERVALEQERSAIESARKQREEEEAERTRLQESASKELPILPAALHTPPIEKPAAAAKSSRPTDAEIIEVLALHFRVHESKIIEWLLDVDLAAAGQEMAVAL